MRTATYKALAVVTALITLAVIALIIIGGNSSDDVKGSAAHAGGAGWSWTNPVTSNQVVIPAAWKRSRGEAARNTLLTLEHWTGKGVVYLVHEETGYGISTPDYIAARKQAIKSQLGIETVEALSDGDGLYQGEGARYFGDTIAGTRVLVWKRGPGEFWRAASIADLEFKGLEYDAREVIGLLMETARPDSGQGRDGGKQPY